MISVQTSIRTVEENIPRKKGVPQDDNKHDSLSLAELPSLSGLTHQNVGHQNFEIMKASSHDHSHSQITTLAKIPKRIHFKVLSLT